MKIRSYSLYRAKSKLPKPIADSTHQLTEISFLVVRIKLDNGIEGESHMLCFQYSPGAIGGALHDVGQLIINEEVFNTASVFEKINQFNEYFGKEGVNRWAQAAFNIAMWDAWCKILGQPIWKILGTCCTKVPVYGSGGWLSYTPDELVDEVACYKKRGFQAVKIKVGSSDWRKDLERLKMVRSTVGRNIGIMMDANQGMDVPSALQLARAVKELDIHWFEEPILHTDFDGYRSLKQQAGISLAMGEREYNTIPLRELARHGALDIWQPDILRLGGVEKWRESAALAGAFNIPVLPHYYKEYDVPLLCTIPNGKGAESFDWVDSLIDCPLKIENGRFTFDFDDLKSKIGKNTKLLLLCNPQNPGGMVWTQNELEELSDICLENNILVISDEIHSDLVFSGNRHIPFATISEEAAKNSVVCMAPSKTFNVAGLASSLVIIPDKTKFARYERALNVGHLGMGNIFGLVALEAAYTSGDEWLDQLLDYLWENYLFLENFIRENLPKVKVMKPEATYLIWLDFGEYGMNDEELMKFTVEKAKVGLNNGGRFGTGGDGWLRLNIGCPRSVLDEGLKRLKSAFG
ncbi:MAG: aminotransferase class I/II-fold pyridoxal phosphate-dependent enzyme [Mariniphaga sp.]